jgi:hypothetical protein
MSPNAPTALVLSPSSLALASEPPLAETSLSRAHRLRLSLAALALALLALATATALAVWVAAAIFHTPPGGLA